MKKNISLIQNLVFPYIQVSLYCLVSCNTKLIGIYLLQLPPPMVTVIKNSLAHIRANWSELCMHVTHSLNSRL